MHDADELLLILLDEDSSADAYERAIEEIQEKLRDGDLGLAEQVRRNISETSWPEDVRAFFLEIFVASRSKCLTSEFVQVISNSLSDSSDQVRYAAISCLSELPKRDRDKFYDRARNAESHDSSERVRAAARACLEINYSEKKR